MMKFLDAKKLVEAANFRHACKEFDGSKKLEKGDFEAILEVGRLSPSSFGFEPWKVLVLRDKKLREGLKTHAWGGLDALSNASEFCVILARKGSDLHPQSAYISDFMSGVQGLNADMCEFKREKFMGFQRDHGLLGDENALYAWACRQCYILLGDMLGAAALLGVDSLAIEGFGRENAEKFLENAGLLDRQHFGIALMCAFGYRKHAPKHEKTRKSLGEFVEFVLNNL